VKGSSISYTAVVNTDTIVFTMTSWCSTTTSCPEATNNLDFRIEGLKNYPTTKPPTIPCSLTVDDSLGGKIE